MFITRKEWGTFRSIIKKELNFNTLAKPELGPDKQPVAFYYRGQSYPVIRRDSLDALLAEILNKADNLLATENGLFDLLQTVNQSGSDLKLILEIANKASVLQDNINCALLEREEILKGINDYKSKIVDKPQVDISDDPIIYKIGGVSYECGKAGLCYSGVVTTYFNNYNSELPVIFMWNGKNLGYAKDKHGTIVDEFTATELKSLVTYNKQKEESYANPDRMKTLLVKHLTVPYELINFNSDLQRFEINGKDLMLDLLR